MGAGYFTNKASFSQSGVDIEWRRYAASPVPYSDGHHNTRFAVLRSCARLYSDFWFKSPVL